MLNNFFFVLCGEISLELAAFRVYKINKDTLHSYFQWGFTPSTLRSGG